MHILLRRLSPWPPNPNTIGKLRLSSFCICIYIGGLLWADFELKLIQTMSLCVVVVIFNILKRTYWKLPDKEILDLWFATGGRKCQYPVSISIGIVFFLKRLAMHLSCFDSFHYDDPLWRDCSYNPSCTSNDMCCQAHPHGPCASWRVRSARPRQTCCLYPGRAGAGSSAG